MSKSQAMINETFQSLKNIDRKDFRFKDQAFLTFRILKKKNLSVMTLRNICFRQNIFQHAENTVPNCPGLF